MGRTYDAPAPLPAPETPLPTAETMPPAKLPTPDAAELVALVIQDCCCWGILMDGYRRRSKWLDAFDSVVRVSMIDAKRSLRKL